MFRRLCCVQSIKDDRQNSRHKSRTLRCLTLITLIQCISGEERVIHILYNKLNKVRKTSHL